VRFPEFFKMLVFRSTIAAQVLFEVNFIAKAAGAKGAFVEVVYIALLIVFLFHYLPSNSGWMLCFDILFG
jgi:hypothetical protein